MIGHLDLYVKRKGPLHRMDERAKLIALTGFTAAAIAAPTRPVWPALGLLGLLGVLMAVGRVPATLVARRLLLLGVMVGIPYALSRLGGEQARLAGEVVAVKSLLVAASFVILTATSRAADVLEATGRLQLLRGLSALGEFIVRGVNVLVGEVVRTTRAWALRAPRASVGVRLSGLTAASVSLLGRAAGRSERAGAAMVLRGFDGQLPAPPERVLPAGDVAAGVLFAAASLVIAGVWRWL
jgi:energy-coupling factor transporter transmembrane protein EcfT